MYTVYNVDTSKQVQGRYSHLPQKQPAIIIRQYLSVCFFHTKGGVYETGEDSNRLWWNTKNLPLENRERLDSEGGW
jgi:CRISPR/Cas system CMR-associated protein Cmr5 small subunit